MNRIGWWLVDAVSRLLEQNEQQIVRGDIAEAGYSARLALTELLGLIARRQAILWKSWRPWLALLGLALPVGWVLSVISSRLNHAWQLPFWVIRNYATLDPPALSETGLTLRQLIPPLICVSFVLASWSWICGFVLGTISRRTLWLNGTVLCVVPAWTALLGTLSNRHYQYSIDGWILPLAFYTVVLPLLTTAALVVVPSIWGMYRSRPETMLPLRATVVWVSITVAAFVLEHRYSTWPGAMSLLVLGASWPVGYLVTSTLSKHLKKEKNA